jgi:hypothetical protein
MCQSYVCLFLNTSAVGGSGKSGFRYAGAAAVHVVMCCSRFYMFLSTCIALMMHMVVLHMDAA